mmetsp:Transcript_53265/g.155158  ORF Transcript_53265/g.155158 Transcript_53265/m.155158 type:complete len:260 (-) Transcript_53265:215-994(-)
MAEDTGIVIAVPEDIAFQILHEGYRCSNRRRVPASRNREAALRAYRRFQRSRPPVLLEVVSLPIGVHTTPHKDGIKLSTPHLPGRCLAQAARPHSIPSFTAGSHSFRPSGRTGSLRPSLTAPTINQRAAPRAGCSLNGRENVRTLFHATRESNAHSICAQGSFHAGHNGFLGPGIYFSQTPANARRYCQCRTGTGPIVVLQCSVNLGNLKTVDRGIHTRQELSADGYDSFKEDERDCYMLPDDFSHQIDMGSVYIEPGM